MVLKFSGEALSSPQGFGIDPDRAESIATRVKYIHGLGIQVALVIGGGNIWRGAQGVARGMDQSTADHIGMLATVMNGLALQDALERIGVHTRVQTAIQMNAVAEPYIRRRAIRHLEKGRVVILGAGTGNPFFSTDTAAALRAVEISADILIKATKVDGVFDKDPLLYPDAEKFSKISYMEAINRRLEVMDSTAISLCMDNKLPILVLNLWDEKALKASLFGEQVGTLITS